jgi:2-hydroxychromene-2-carboxylate isomerase
MPRQVDYYFSLQSPWAYIGHRFFREVADHHGLKVNHKPVVLVDLFSETGGLPLMKRHPVRQRYRMVELQRWRDKRGLKFHLQPANWPFNARLADGVVIAAVEQNRQDALAADVFGSPVYVLDGEVFWGQDRIELLADALKSGRAPYRSQV